MKFLLSSQAKYCICQWLAFILHSWFEPLFFSKLWKFVFFQVNHQCLSKVHSLPLSSDHQKYVYSFVPNLIVIWCSGPPAPTQAAADRLYNLVISNYVTATTTAATLGYLIHVTTVSTWWQSHFVIMTSLLYLCNLSHICFSLSFFLFWLRPSLGFIIHMTILKDLELKELSYGQICPD